MKRILGFAAAAALAIGIIPFAASAGPGHVYQPVGDTGFAVGLETPSSQARTCAFVETPGVGEEDGGYHAVGIGAGVYYKTSAGKYDPHNATKTEDDGSICGGETKD